MMKRTTQYISPVRYAALVIAALMMTVLCPQRSSSQSLANYTGPNGSLVRTTGNTYNSIEFTGYSVPSWRFTGSGGEDDNRSYPIPIGFDFWYVGARFTTFSVSTNGFIDFSPATNDGGPATNQYGSTDNDLSQSASTRTMPLTIAPFYYDQTTDSTNGTIGLTALAYGIKYQTSGTVGNRVLTVEWVRTQPWYTGTNGRPSFNYQLKLHEGTGAIEFAYGRMDIGLFDFAAQSINVVQGYTSGMNGTSVSAAPTTAQLLVQQSQNSTNFSNANATGGAADAPHTLNILPASYSTIVFTPPTPSGAPTNAAFASVSQTAMTVNWTDNASNEVGYAVYRSDDGGSTYNFITQLPANTATYTQTGLLAGTTYYWRIYAVTEGALSAPLNCSQATLDPGQFISVQSGLWNTPSTWLGNLIPTSSANVLISDGTTVQVDGDVTVNSITVGGGTSGSLLIGNSTTGRTVNVVGLIDVKAGATFSANPSFAATHSLNTTGNIQNAGVFDLAPNGTSRMQIFFNRAGQQTITGNGATTRVHTITLNMGTSQANILDVFASQFTSATAGFLTINNGTFNIATSGPAATTYTIFSGNARIPATGALRINHPAASVATIGGTITLAGQIQLNGGRLQIGNAADNNLVIDGGRLDLSGSSADQISIAGRLEPANTYALTDLNITGGSLIVGRVGSTSTTNAPFTMNVPGSRFVMSGGAIVIQQSGGGASTLGYENRNYQDYSVTGGTVQFGNGSTPSAQIMNVNTTVPVYNFVVNSSNATARLVNTNVAVLNDVSITLGTLNANALNMSVGGNWVRAVSGAVFTPTSGKITFDGSGAQSVSMPETFYKLSIAKSGGTLAFGNNVTAADSFALSQGTLNIQSTTLTLNGAVTGGGTLLCGAASTVNYTQGSGGQNVLVSDYGSLTFSAYAKVLPQSTIGILGTFTPAGTGHTITNNTIDFKSASPQSIPLFTYNNLTLSTGGTKTASGTVTVNGILTVQSSVTLNNSTYAVNVLGGGIVHNGSHAVSAGAIVLQGAAAQTITGSGSFNNLTVNTPAGVTLGGSLTVNSALGLTSGVINAGANTVSALGTVTRTSGYVNGKLLRAVTVTGNPIVFDVGDAAAYAPATVTFTSLTAPGTLTVWTTAGDHPQIGAASSTFDITNNVNRYWTLTNSGTVFASYGTVFTFNAADLDISNTYSTFIGGLWNGTVWTYPATGTRTATTTSLSGMTAFGDFAIGNTISSGMYQTQASGNWNALTTWLRYNGTSWVQPTSGQGVPTSNNAATVTINSGHTVTVTSNATIDQTVIESGGQVTINSGTTLTLNNGSGDDLTVNGVVLNNGTLKLNSGSAIAVGDGGRYIHGMSNAGSSAVPAGTWDANSTCEIRGVTTAANNTFTGSLGQTFGHFIWNCAAQSAASNLAGALLDVRGNFSVLSTNGQQLILYGNQSATTAIGGSLFVTGGTLNCKNNTGAAIVNVAGGLTVNGGTLQLGSGTGIVSLKIAGSAAISSGTLDLAAGGGADTLYVFGDYAHTGGTVTETGSAAGTILFAGTAAQTFTSGGTATNTVNYVALPGSTLKLPASTVVSGANFTLRDGANIEIQSASGITTVGTASGNVQTTVSRVFGTAANYTYSGTGAQTTGNALPSSVNKLIINNSGGSVTQTSATTTVSNELNLISGNYNVAANTLILNNLVSMNGGTLSSGAAGTVIYNQQSAGQSVLPMSYGNLTFSNYSKILPSSGTIQIAGTFTPGSAASHTITNSTIEFNGGSQTIPVFTYYNLTFSGTSAAAAASFDILGLLTINSNLTLNGTTVIASAQGNLVNTRSVAGTGKISLTSGTASHAISGSGQYNNLELNDPYGANASSNITVTNLLTLTTGILTDDTTHSVILTGTAAVSRTNGYVNGKLQKPIAASGAPSSYVFEIGDATAYTPVSITFNTVTSPAGTLTVYTTPGRHPYDKYSGLDASKDVNRYWTLVAGGGLAYSKYDVKFDFVNGDVDAGANPNAFFVKRFASHWYAAYTATRNSNWILSQNNMGLGDYLVGELSAVIYWTDITGDHKWSTPDNWSSNSLPTASNDILLEGTDPATINVDLDLAGPLLATCKNLTMQNPALTLTIQTGKALTLAGNLSQTGGTFSTQNAFPAVTGTVAISGGLFGYDAPSGSQTVAALSYRGLRISGGGTKTAAGSFAVDSTLSVLGGAFDLGTYTVTAKEHIVNSSSVIGAGKIVLSNASAGVATHTISSAGSFSNLELNDTKGASLANNTTVASLLTMTSGVLNTGSNTLTITGTRSGPGIIIGTVTRTHAFALNTPYEFEGPNTTITFDSAQTLPGSVTVRVVLDSSAIVNPNMNPINRYYDVTPAGGSSCVYRLKLHYEDAELGSGNSETSPSLKIWWNQSSNNWTRLGATANSTVDNWVQWNGVTQSGRFSLSSRPVADLKITLASSSLSPVPGDQVTYTIQWHNIGDGVATNSLFSAFIPANTTFVAGSVQYNSISTTDFTIAGNVITFNMTALNGGTIPAGGTGTITYKVTIN